MNCHACNKPLEPNWKYCSECGTKRLSDEEALAFRLDAGLAPLFDTEPAKELSRKMEVLSKAREILRPDYVAMETALRAQVTDLLAENDAYRGANTQMAREIEAVKKEHLRATGELSSEKDELQRGAVIARSVAEEDHNG